MESCKEGKRQGCLITQNFIFRFTTILWRRTFSWTNGGCHVSLRRCWDILLSFSGRYKSCVRRLSSGCFQWGMLAEATCKQQIWLSGPGFQYAYAATASRREKRSFDSSGTSWSDRHFLRCPEAPFFRHAWELPLIGLLENCYNLAFTLLFPSIFLLMPLIKYFSTYSSTRTELVWNNPWKLICHQVQRNGDTMTSY